MWVFGFFSLMGMPVADLKNTAGRSNLLASSPGCLHRHCICQPMLHMLKKSEILWHSAWKSPRHPHLRLHSICWGDQTVQPKAGTIMLVVQVCNIGLAPLWYPIRAVYWWMLAIFPILVQSDYSMTPNWSIPLTSSSTLYPTCTQKRNQTKCKGKETENPYYQYSLSEISLIHVI